MTNRVKTSSAVTALAATMLCCGCFSSAGKSPERRFYLLDVSRTGPARAASSPATLTVRPFTMAPGFRSRELLYRTGPFAYESDYYTRFISSAEGLIAERTRQWLAAAGVVSAVVQPGSLVEPTYVLDGNVTALYADFRKDEPIRGVLGIEFFLLHIRPDGPQVTFHKAYHAETKVETQDDGKNIHTSADKLIGAYNECLRQILADLEEDLSSVVLKP